MASSCNAFGRRDGCIETGRLGTAGASRNHSHSGPRAGRISDRAHHCRCYRSTFANWEATRWCSRSAFSGRRRSFLSAARFRRAYYGGVSAPVYTPIETLMGTGVVGGRVLSYEHIGRQAGEILGRLFSGQPGWQHMPKAPASVLGSRWRQSRLGNRSQSDSADAVD